ncbi:uncharacterized protein N7483_006042 [Penicillium malachiteum]|uniref:uncharacterized protein n=1 Tax=Penicillium malachiteum TaxID=1324776 RepID=UPI002549603D|nr:uncharacterized protein N7483_006042 [Penicillium malachiteum]KAJ5731534.1 hypothetical protein N7483_006042 [Penicillium malachiteum]
MPRKPTPAGKQRVRTGCLTCRKRRRKCDEQKPRCANCEVKGFSCKYGSDLAFVPPKSGQAAGGTRQAYNSITFVDDSPAARTSANKEKSRSRQSPLSGDQSDLHEGVIQPVKAQFGNDATFNNILNSNEPVDYPGPSSLEHGPEMLLNTEEQRVSIPYHGYLGFAASYQRLVHRPTPANTSYETDLLRHFRYHVGPWIDTGDSNCALGVQVLLHSRTNRSLQAAVLALSAGQRSLISLMNSDDIENILRFRKEAEEEEISPQTDVERHAGKALLLLQELLPAGLQQWRSIIASRVEYAGGFMSPTDLAQGLGDALFWFYFQLDLAASISDLKSPITPFCSFVKRDGTPLHDSHFTTSKSSVIKAYQHILCHLGHCLALIYGKSDGSSPYAAGSPRLAAFSSLRQSHFLSQWAILWNDCQKWYHERPVDVQQIVDVRGSEADQIDPDHDSSFPILIYTTPVALVANAVYHITSLLLLNHKPRLLKSLPGPRSFTSHIWHAQSIAGIAVSNDSPEQWDPILVTGLLLVAKEMTHHSQQKVLLERLKIITSTTGMNLERETETLQAAWRMARYDEELEAEGNDG